MAGKAEFAYSVIAGNDVPVVAQFPVAASQTLSVGDVVVLSSGKVAAAGNGTGRVLGVMAQASSSAAAGTMVSVYVSRPGLVWKMTASADATSHVLTSTRTYDLTSTQLVNVADTTGGCLWPVALGSTTTSVFVIFTAHEMA